MSHEEVLESKIRIVPDFPKPGIQFLDLSTLFKDADGFKLLIDLLYEKYKDENISQVAGIESRGFVVAAALAYRLGAGVQMIRKPGKLPWRTVSESYALEYGTNEVHVHEDAFSEGERVLLVDDLLATGGTMAAAANLCEKIGANIVGVAFIVELTFLPGREKLTKYPIYTLISKS